MSVVTNVILTCSLMERPDALPQINAFFQDNVPLFEPAEASAGTKYLECIVLIGAINYLDLDGFVAHLQGLVWDDPQNVQLFVQEQEENRFREIPLFPEGVHPNYRESLERRGFL